MIRNKKNSCGLYNFECKRPVFRTFTEDFVADLTNYNVFSDSGTIKNRKSD
jgi:hypothetical protein